MGVSKNRGKKPKSSISIGFSIIFTIHFGIPLFLETPISPPEIIGCPIEPQTSAHRSGDRLIPLASSFELIVGFYMVSPTKSLTFSPGDLRVAMKQYVKNKTRFLWDVYGGINHKCYTLEN